MHDESSIDRLNDTLNSRTEYIPPEDTRAPVSPEEPVDVPEKWDSPDLDTLINERVDGKHSSLVKKIFIASIVLFVLALAAAGYVFFVGGNFISTKNVDIAVTGPAEIDAGEPLSLTLSVDNKNNASLEDVVLSIKYPDGTRKASDMTSPLSEDQAKLDSIAAGGESTQTFQSVLYGEKGDVETLTITLEYKVAGSNAIFYKDKTFDVTIGETPLTISVDHPDNISSGQPFDTTILVSSNSSDVLHGVLVRAEYPYGFSLTSSDPAQADSNLWSLGDLAPGEKRTIVLHGSIAGVNDEDRTFRYYAGVADASGATTLKDPLVSMTDTIHISRPSLGISISMNGKSEGDYIAPTGSQVNATINYVNNSTDKLTGTTITARISGGALDPRSVEPSQGGFYDSSTGLVTWQSPNVAGLASLAPGDSGSVSVGFSSLSSLPAGKNQSITIVATIAGQPDGIASADALTNSVTKTVKISSTVNFSGKALYSRGPFTNTGPFPPQADATTTYTVVLDLGNTQNDVGNAIVTARLGPNVSFVSGGEGSDAVIFDPLSGTLTWNVGTLVSGAGYSAPLREATFQVALKPSIGQIGTVPALVQSISFSGTDTFTNLPVSATLPAITTKLLSDTAFVQGDDTVVK